MKELLKKGLRGAGLERPVRAAVWRASNFGLSHECPFCGHHIKAFRAEGERHAVLFEQDVVGGGWREGCTCPLCGSVDRERLVCLFLRRHPELLEAPKKIMHVAPEAKLEEWLRALSGLDYLSADLTDEHVDVNLDLTAIPFQEASFDAVIANHILEHIPDDALAMREIHRILKPGGWAILQVPISLKRAFTDEDPSVTDPQERERRFGQNDHVRIYTAHDYVARLARAGFHVEPFSWETRAYDYGGTANKFGLLRKETLFFVRRPLVA
ncbi:MAG TPA: methyltransferase domain-containing protein [Caulobacterales bacterium]|nr:methyltransferase domain-containing protein [Caulobacterales bacterium]